MIGVLEGQVGALMLLDLSSAFDTVDHDILTSVLRRRFGVDGPALDFLSDFLSGRSQVVRVGTSESDAVTLHFGVPHQGSVIGSKWFLEYAEDVSLILSRLRYHMFARLHARPRCL